MELDISRTPFSKYGSYVSVGKEASGSLIVRSVRRRFGQERFLTLDFWHHGAAIGYEVSATPSTIAIQSQHGTARISLHGDNGLVIDSSGLDIVLSLVGGGGFGFQAGPQHFQLVSLWNALWGAVRIYRGVGTGSFGWELKSNTYQGPATITVSAEGNRATVGVEISPVQSMTHNVKVPDIAQEITETETQWEAFLSRMPDVPEAYYPSARLAWYNLWSCFVRAEGNFHYDAILMSKATMAAVWPWDHCFNALALAPADVKAAIEQFLLPFEIQQPSGMLPDFVQVDSRFDMVTKTPIHGWCIDRILHGREVDRATLQHIYGRLVKWTEWWFEYRDCDGDGIPHYLHGWDAWDNSTMFDHGPCLESGDLSAYLVLQMHSLAGLARRLDDVAAAVDWERRAEALLQKLYAHSWNGSVFVAKTDGSHYFDPEPTSLLSIMPLVLGEHLDVRMFKSLADRLDKDYLTAFGPATEMPKSPKYLSDGYWRGPIWAPTTYLLIDGLRRGGRMDLAREIARRFCETVRKSGGNFENYDSLTGKGLREQGYTWTAAVHVLLLHEYLLEK